MRKFKIKNRRKRKYVKKQELASSISSVQSLTVGLVPLILMAIAFLATFLISNSAAIRSATLPTLDMPEVRFTWELPALPKTEFPTAPAIETPSLELPEVKPPAFEAPKPPEITVPDILPSITAAFTAFAVGVNNSVQSVIGAVVEFDNMVVTGTAKLFGLLDPRPGAIALGEFVTGLLSSMQQTTVILFIAISKFVVMLTTSVTQTFLAIMSAIAGVFFTVTNFLDVLLIEVTQAVAAWLVAAFKAVVSGINAAVWWIGTPFRALGEIFTQIGIMLQPFFDFLEASVDQSLYDLSAGGETLFQGGSYVSESMAEPK